MDQLGRMLLSMRCNSPPYRSLWVGTKFSGRTVCGKLRFESGKDISKNEGAGAFRKHTSAPRIMPLDTAPAENLKAASPASW
ncbi:hypothetical protein scyTo_0014334 [Scyliorhinus torazame]|uniref:Uncharacterized protein n=1 Tax=Scyliorhinus torazame TaxID=75743 RepID=A0A401NKQ7_SCYTO|nr:hypothetical protein [Scyliorhinus torazame]